MGNYRECGKNESRNEMGIDTGPVTYVNPLPCAPNISLHSHNLFYFQCIINPISSIKGILHVRGTYNYTDYEFTLVMNS